MPSFAVEVRAARCRPIQLPSGARAPSGGRPAVRRGDERQRREARARRRRDEAGQRGPVASLDPAVEPGHRLGREVLDQTVIARDVAEEAADLLRGLVVHVRELRDQLVGRRRLLPAGALDQVEERCYLPGEPQAAPGGQNASEPERRGREPGAALDPARERSPVKRRRECDQGSDARDQVRALGQPGVAGMREKARVQPARRVPDEVEPAGALREHLRCLEMQRSDPVRQRSSRRRLVHREADRAHVRAQ